MRKLVLLVLSSYCLHLIAGNFEKSSLNDDYYVYAIINESGDTALYPSLKDRIHIQFTDDSLYFETFCYNTKPGTSYKIIGDSVIKTDPLLTPLECFHPDQELADWNWEVTSMMNMLSNYTISDSYLTFYVGEKTLILIKSEALGNNAFSNNIYDEILMKYTNDYKGEITIHFDIPPFTKNAFLKIYDISGRNILTEVISTSGKSKLKVSDKIPSVGMYICTLYISNRQVKSIKIVI